VRPLAAALSGSAFTAALALLLIGPIASPLNAQRVPEPGASGEPNVPEKAGKTLIARRLTAQPPRIDGALDDAVWLSADSIVDLVQWEPDNMAPPAVHSVVRLVYDDRNIYVGVHAYDTAKAGLSTGLGRRDKPPPSDFFAIGFDPRHDHQTGYAFEINASGVRSDYQFLDDDRVDYDYDAVWEARAIPTADGWSAEFRIPFSQLRFPATAGAALWGFEVRRAVHRTGEIAQWVGRPRGQRGQVSRWGHLVFEDALSAPRRVELTPFGLMRRASSHDTPGSDHDVRFGADFRLGLGPSTTLAGTVLPDFGHVEADPAVLNLTVFETFFPERRPFFLEDGNIFVPPYGLFRLFHSRRIGRPPGHLRLAADETLLDRPDDSRILGAAKVTSRGKGWTYGVVSAVTAEEHALVERPFDGEAEATEIARRLIEPRTSYSAVRVQRDVGSNSNVGWLGTAVVRDGAQNAFTTGVDYFLRWDRNRWYLNGHWAGSRAPDAGSVETGIGGVTNLGYNRKHWNFWVHTDHFSPDFNINDIGFLRTRNNRTELDGGFELSQPDPWAVFRNVSAFSTFGRGWNRDGIVFQQWRDGGVYGRFLNFWQFEIGGGAVPRVLDDLDTRGGPPIVRPRARRAWLFLGTDTRKRWQLTGNSVWDWDVEDGSSRSSYLDLRFNPSARVQTSTRIDYRRTHAIAQWIANLDATGDGSVDHVYGVLDSRVVDVTLRGTFAVDQDLTFELFAQPFVAVGDYSDFRRLARPSSFDFEPVEIAFDPDFNRKSLRGNAVLRWEYRPGSTLFLVWNVLGTDLSRPGEFSLRRDFADALGVPRNNVFMLKATYWLAM
jgi:hypothetical protein